MISRIKTFLGDPKEFFNKEGKPGLKRIDDGQRKKLDIQMAVGGKPKKERDGGFFGVGVSV